MKNRPALYVAKLEQAFLYLDRAVQKLSAAHFHSGDKHQQLGTHDLLNQAIRIRDGVSTLKDIARKQLEAKSQELGANS